jgi:hypothetical protein
MSFQPSLFISIILTPALYPSNASIPEAEEISSKIKSPLFKYSLSFPCVDVKYKSGRPSLLTSPIATPPPLYK